VAVKAQLRRRAKLLYFGVSWGAFFGRQRMMAPRLLHQGESTCTKQHMYCCTAECIAGTRRIKIQNEIVCVAAATCLAPAPHAPVTHASPVLLNRTDVQTLPRSFSMDVQGFTVTLYGSNSLGPWVACFVFLHCDYTLAFFPIPSPLCRMSKKGVAEREMTAAAVRARCAALAAPRSNW